MITGLRISVNDLGQRRKGSTQAAAYRPTSGGRRVSRPPPFGFLGRPCLPEAHRGQHRVPEELSDRPAGRCGPDPAQYAGHRPAAGPEAVLVGFGGSGVVVMVGSGPELWDTIAAELDRSGADLPDLLTLGEFDADRAALSSMPPPRSPATSRSPHPTATPTEVLAAAAGRAAHRSRPRHRGRQLGDTAVSDRARRGRPSPPRRRFHEWFPRCTWPRDVCGSTRRSTASAARDGSARRRS